MQNVALRVGVGIGALLFVGLLFAVGTPATQSTSDLDIVLNGDAISGSEAYGFQPERGSAEWQHVMGMEPATEDQIVGLVPFTVRLPGSIGDLARTGLYLKSETVVPGELDAKQTEERIPLPVSERRVYAEYGDVLVLQYWPDGEGAVTPSGFVAQYDENPGAEAYLVNTEVGGLPALAWNSGEYEMTLEDGTAATVELETSVVAWVEEGVLVSVTSQERGYEELLRLAQAFSRVEPRNPE